MKKIPLTQNQYMLIDDEDFVIISKLKLYANFHPIRQVFNASTSLKTKTGKWKTVYIHRYLLNAPNNKQVDHINGNTLDNRRKNLRLATASQNQANKMCYNKYGFKGVKFSDKSRSGRKFRAIIRPNGKYISIGYFSSAKKAAIAYNVAAKKYYSEFALLNKLNKTKL